MLTQCRILGTFLTIILNKKQISRVTELKSRYPGTEYLIHKISYHRAKFVNYVRHAPSIKLVIENSDGKRRKRHSHLCRARILQHSFRWLGSQQRFKSTCDLRTTILFQNTGDSEHICLQNFQIFIDLKEINNKMNLIHKIRNLHPRQSLWIACY